ncbi:bifunctional hydroxymethylpyrimidine kinase/phosphomethylpyrimidine kinase [Rhodoferax sp.]|uniref:bifunctional hydroxymethylpyrimidine kinase/phosphomethylpyrimidine kinase n=1 Tax=Rhodoferax sp. TaxID=50421 RepID=UPI001ED75A68|nr:bifunctional hydroxymethylpyrimidine kinase/phosphomethylpyrimidine kinase [Rhodoferax sp.]MBT9506751.1 bifunctional hydroxymethylpyrimidine kinase/phosphomethylpyrimidine kinase [Rhodoferax sp.]
MSVDAFKFEYPRVLSIAGSDSGGGAGIQADLKTFSALGCYGMTAITALTAQNTLGVRAIHGVPPQMLRDQINAVMEDLGADAVKIGMLHSPDIVRTVAEAVDRHALRNVVFDPVMVATSGAVLIDNGAVDVLVRELFPRVDVITPNLDEAALLVGQALKSAQDMEQAALALLAKGARAVLLKGGHLPGDTVIDLLMTCSGEKFWMQAARIHSANTHGTGCTLSSAMAAHLALGASLLDAVQHARTYVREALLSGAQVRTGQGSGPLNHGHAPVAMQLKPLR